MTAVGSSDTKLLPGVGESVILRASSLDETVARILADIGWNVGDTRVETSV